MSSIDEKRVYDPDTDAETAFVASDTGLAAISIAGGRVGNVSLRYREPAYDVVTTEDRVLVATDEGVLELATEGARELGGGPVVTVALDDRGRVLAGGGETLSRLDDGRWRALGSVGEIRAIDGDLVASEEGIYRIVGDEPRYSGLGDVWDVTSAGRPHAATAEGLYALANGWTDVLMGAFSVVSADPRTATHGALGRAYAVGDDACFEHTAEGWERRSPTKAEILDVVYGEGTCAVTAEDLLLADGEDWRTHPLGLEGVHALAIAPR